MNIAILTHNFHAQSHKRLVEAGIARQHNMRIVNLSYCYMSLSEKKPTLFYRSGETFDNLHAIIPRIPREHTYYGTALLRQFERLNIFTLNSALSILWTQDKVRAIQQLAKHGFAMPAMGVADSPQESEKLIDLVGGVPLIVRLLEGTEGKGTIFAETHQAAVSVINAFKQLKTNILVQEYITEAEDTDVRCVVIGNKVVGATLRKVEKLRNGNHHKIISYHPVKLTKTEKTIAIQAAKTMKLNMAIIDLIRSHRGPLILDVDASPNLELLEKNTQMDIMVPLFNFIEQHLSPTRDRD